MFIKPSIYILGAASICMVMFQNCSQHSFTAVEAAQKSEALELHAGFGNEIVMDHGDSGLNGSVANHNDDGGVSGIVANHNDDGGVSRPVANHNDDSGVSGPGSLLADIISGNPQGNGFPLYIRDLYDGGVGTNRDPNQFDVGQDPVTEADKGRFHVIRWCRGADRGATLKDATTLKVVVRDLRKHGNICEASSREMLDQVLAGSSVDIPNCDFSAIPNKYLSVQVTNQNNESLSDGTDSGHPSNAFDDGRLRSDSSPQVSIEVVGLHLLLDKDMGRTEAKDCDAYNSSPLVVDMRSKRNLRKPISLSSPNFGVVFDILGMNSDPSPYTPKQISWFRDPKIMPLVLPKNGDVQGIDQMFGDNTLGPDNDFAADGFAALAKYDGLNLMTNEVEEADGYITRDDPIYSKLRLWHDRNLDAKVDRGELISLRRAKVEVIDLNFDPKYYSRDKFGNEIKFKSVVKLKNGDYKPIFDVWFALYKDLQK